ncbi:hypothetical protein BGZ83_007300 [Gryganskiella cystojenkinii]|nr:hypothetical protein BGZ83_007300 [Gryganskiella cystojenkinii]
MSQTEEQGNHGRDTAPLAAIPTSKILDRTLFSRKEMHILIGAILVNAICHSFEVNLMYGCLGAVIGVFEVISLGSILPTILEIIATALVPFYTKFSDVVGRAQALTISMLFYLLGYAIQGTSKVFLQFALGQISYGIGSTGLLTIMQILMADATKLVDRGVLFAMWDMPTVVMAFIINPIINPLTDINNGANWRIIYIIIGVVAGVGAVSLLIPLWHLQRKAERSTASRGQQIVHKDLRWLLQEYDAVGAVLIAAGLSLTLLPIIIAKSHEGNWTNPRILGMFFSGLVILVLLVIWEVKFSNKPIMPMRIWTDRTTFGGLAVIFLFTVMNAFNYVYYGIYLVVARDVDFGRAQLLERGYQVIWPIAELATGLLMKRYNTYRPFIWAGIVIHTVGLGLQIPARKPTSSDFFVVAAQVVAGGAAGMANVAAIIAITGSVAKADVATVIGASRVLNSFGYAFGSALSGGIWTQYLPARLAKHIVGEYDENLAMNDYFEYIKNMTATDPIKKAQLVEAYADAQMLLLIIGMCIAVPVAIITFFMRDIDLRKKDEEEEGDAVKVDDRKVEGEITDPEIKN